MKTRNKHDSVVALVNCVKASSRNSRISGWAVETQDHFTYIKVGLIVTRPCICSDAICVQGDTRVEAVSLNFHHLCHSITAIFAGVS